MQYEISKSGLFVERQVSLPIVYEGIKMEAAYRIDLFVERKVIIEIKSVEELVDLDFKQLVTYLKLSKVKVGLLVNFNTSEIIKSIHRRVNDFED